MAIIEEGKVVILFFMAIYYAIKLVSHYVVDHGIFEPKVERIPALDAIDEAIDRCVEMGRPIYYTVGDWATLSAQNAAAVMAGINILGYVAEKAAEKRVPLYVAVPRGELYVLMMETVREAYVRAGRLEDFDPEKVLYWSDTWPAFQTGTFYLFEVEKPAAYMNIGFAADSAVNTPGYAILRGIDCVTIGGCTDRTQIPPMIYGCENWLVAEELFAGAQYVGGTKEAGGGMAGTDIAKLILMALIVIGAVVASTGVNLLSTLLSI